MITGLYPHAPMRDSRTGWLGEIPEHWAMTRAKWLFQKLDRPVKDTDEVVTCFRDGVVTLRKNRRLTGFTEALQEHGYQGIRRGDLVIHAMDAFAGAMGVSDSDGKGTPVYSVCRPLTGVNPWYYAYVLREMARSQWILALSTGIRERSTDFRFEAFARQLLPAPPVGEQQLIVRFLSDADHRIGRFIKAKQELIALLREQRQVIIYHAVTAGLHPDVPLKPFRVGAIADVPEHWTLARLKTRLSRNDGGAWGSDFADSGTVVLRSTEQTQYGEWQIESPARRLLTERELQQTLLRAGDLLVTKSSGSPSHIGKATLVTARIEEMGCGFSNFMQRLRSDDTLEPRYLWWFLNSRVAREQFRYFTSTTTGLGNLSGGILGNLRVAFPPLSEQRAIDAYLGKATLELNRAMTTASREISLLREYRSRLILDVVAGKLDMREVADQLPDDAGELEPSYDTKALAEVDEGAENADLDADLEEVKA
jgi:type I restriction enzyme S subunit